MGVLGHKCFCCCQQANHRTLDAILSLISVYFCALTHKQQIGTASVTINVAPWYVAVMSKTKGREIGEASEELQQWAKVRTSTPLETLQQEALCAIFCALTRGCGWNSSAYSVDCFWFTTMSKEYLWFFKEIWQLWSTIEAATISVTDQPFSP